MTDYTLTTFDKNTREKLNFWKLARQFWHFLKDEKKKLIGATLAIAVNSTATIAAPFVLGYTIDHFIVQKNLNGITNFSLILAGIYLITFVTNFVQVRIMGTLGQNILFKLRNSLFSKIQSLPLKFFNQNKIGDLISRINNDTDKLNQFFSQQLNQFVGNIFTLIGIGIFIFVINYRLAVVTLSAAIFLFIITSIISPWIAQRNRLSLQSLGGLSAEVSESLNYFKVIVSFNRRDYFRENFNRSNTENFQMSFRSGIANNLMGPIYDFSGNLATLLVLLYGIFLITQGQLSIGILVSFLSYTDRFYGPLRQMASLWAGVQTALAAWNRIFEILRLKSDMEILPESKKKDTKSMMHFENVVFGYDEKKPVLKKVNFNFLEGKTYAIVGPTGGGKSTIASLMSRLYDPQQGTVYLNDCDIRTYRPEDLARKIGFILQEQYLFTGTVGENIVYGNPEFKNYSKKKLEKLLSELNLENLINKFEDGLDTKITYNSDSISLGQKQLISFIRAIIRHPELLIMDEATANIDTVTEGLLQTIIDKLPKNTTKVIIAHRLNTIKNADEIYFVNNGQVITAESFKKSVEMIAKSKNNS
ncbi:MAG TPA: ABC transporter ATP-binding protein [Candidatus Woesebacteria bacterium]|nr:ABC transporter ATP-binding protein [Candidatus Woesebacteria bacterium]